MSTPAAPLPPPEGKRLVFVSAKDFQRMLKSGEIKVEVEGSGTIDNTKTAKPTPPPKLVERPNISVADLLRGVAERTNAALQDAISRSEEIQKTLLEAAESVVKVAVHERDTERAAKAELEKTLSETRDRVKVLEGQLEGAQEKLKRSTSHWEEYFKKESIEKVRRLTTEMERSFEKKVEAEVQKRVRVLGEELVQKMAKEALHVNEVVANKVKELEARLQADRERFEKERDSFRAEREALRAEGEAWKKRGEEIAEREKKNEMLKEKLAASKERERDALELVQKIQAEMETLRKAPPINWKKTGTRFLFGGFYLDMLPYGSVNRITNITREDAEDLLSKGFVSAVGKTSYHYDMPDALTNTFNMRIPWEDPRARGVTLSPGDDAIVVTFVGHPADRNPRTPAAFERWKKALRFSYVQLAAAWTPPLDS